MTRKYEPQRKKAPRLFTTDTNSTSLKQAEVQNRSVAGIVFTRRKIGYDDDKANEESDDFAAVLCLRLSAVWVCEAETQKSSNIMAMPRRSI